MTDTKLTVRVSKELLENLKQFARAKDTTVTKLIEAYLQRIPPESRMQQAAIVRRLSGVLSPNVGVEDYKQHLEEKYGQ